MLTGEVSTTVYKSLAKIKNETTFNLMSFEDEVKFLRPMISKMEPSRPGIPISTKACRKILCALETTPDKSPNVFLKNGIQVNTFSSARKYSFEKLDCPPPQGRFFNPAIEEAIHNINLERTDCEKIPKRNKAPPKKR